MFGKGSRFPSGEKTYSGTNMTGMDQTRYYSHEIIQSFAVEALKAAGAEGEMALLTAKGLCHASLRGVDSHGIRLLPHYVAALKSGRINQRPNFEFVRTSHSTGMLDADHGFGHAAGIKAMSNAVELAKESGSGNVVVKNSSHCGALAYFALEACRHDFIGLAVTHATSRLMSTGSNRPFFGNNPICVAAPMAGEDPFCFDGAMSAITFNKVKQHRENQQPLPPMACADDNGIPTEDPELASQLLPIGGYKGFGLAMVVDILCGLLANMPTGRDISSMYDGHLSQKRFLGQFFSAIRIDAFIDVCIFKQRLKLLVESVRGEPRCDPNVGVMVAGDPEKCCHTERIANGLPINALYSQKFVKLAETLGIESLDAREKKKETP